jgi:purine-binding chemotaxis protein CheW
MAKRSPRASRQDNVAACADVGITDRTVSAGDEADFVMFRIAVGQFGFRLKEVREILRPPTLAYMPLAPRSMLGLANLRGTVLPVVSARHLLDFEDTPVDDDTRVIVVDCGTPVGFVVDRIDRLLALAASRIEKDNAGSGSVNPDVLEGVVKGAEGESTTKILNPQRLLRDEFTRLGVSGQRSETRATVSAAMSGPIVEEPRRHVSLVSFDLCRQEYALPLDRVQEIIQLPDQVSDFARSETAVRGVITLRDRLLPLVSLRALLGLPNDAHREERGRVVVLSMGRGSIGVIADRTRDILHIDPDLVDPAPTLLTRGAGDAEVTSICRLDDGRRLVAVLSPDRLFRSELVLRLISDQNSGGDAAESPMDQHTMADEQFIVFWLGDQEYGLPVRAVNEVTRPPDQIARLPRAPAFVDGVMNLRGSVVPVIDLRRRFELTPKEQAGGRRILVLAVNSGKAGFLVDGVSEIMKVPAGAIRPSPELSAEQARLIGRVANIEAQDRMILLVDPAQLLNQVEGAVLATFHRVASKEAAPGS